MLMFLQDRRAFALKIALLKDSELRKLEADLPLCTIEAKAPSTSDCYSKVYIFSLPFLFLYFRTRALVNEMPAPILCFVIV